VQGSYILAGSKYVAYFTVSFQSFTVAEGVAGFFLTGTLRLCIE
jgi:hypothetical protein